MQVRNTNDRERNFDFNGFLSAVDAYRTRAKKSWRQVSRETGVSASSLTRMSQGKRLDIDGMIALSIWANLELDNYKRTPSQGAPHVNTADQVAALLRGDPNLSEQDAEHLGNLIRASYEHLSEKRKEDLDDE